MRVVDGEARRVDPLAQVVAHPLLARQLFQQRGVLGDQAEGPVDPGEPDPAEAPDELPEVGRQAGGERELAVLRQRGDHRVGRDPRGRGVPEREGREAIGVDMLRALLQLGEGCDRVAGLGVGRVVDFQEHRAVALHDQRVGGMVLHGLLAGMTGGEGRRGGPLPCGSGLMVDFPTPARKVGLPRGQGRQPSGDDSSHQWKRPTSMSAFKCDRSRWRRFLKGRGEGLGGGPLHPASRQVGRHRVSSPWPAPGPS